jgi:uncharacterized repeat protein (TIGR02543 family)
MNIKGGEITGGLAAVANGISNGGNINGQTYKEAFEAAGVKEYAAKTIISGGEIKGDLYSYGAANATIAVNGGNIDGGFSTKSNGQISITCGTFTASEADVAAYMDPGVSKTTKDGKILVGDPTYSVIFDADNGEEPVLKTVAYGKTVAAYTPAKNGYAFLGWYTKDGEKFDFTTPIVKDTVLYAKWKGVSVPVYGITVNDAEGGTIKASAYSATEGAVIVLTPVPADEDGELVSLTVTDASGNALTLTKRSNGTYSFVMPAEKVTVTGTFTAVADTEEPEEPAEDEEPSEETTENPFTDVEEGNDYYEAILWAVENGITKGTSATTFSPAMDCTRAQVVTFLWRAAGSPEPTTTENPFTDVEEGTDYYKAILWAVENGITKGTSATTFSPAATCTRAQVVTFLYRAAGQPELTTTENPFTDVETGNDYYNAILWAVENGITKGTSATTFSPSVTCNRAQIVTFLYRNAAEAEAED